MRKKIRSFIMSMGMLVNLTARGGQNKAEGSEAMKLDTGKYRKCKKLPYCMVFFLNVLDDYYEYGIHMKETWKEADIQKEAKEELKELELLTADLAGKVIDTCLVIVKAAMFIMEADLWLNAVYVLQTELSEQIKCGVIV